MHFVPKCSSHQMVNFKILNANTISQDMTMVKRQLEFFFTSKITSGIEIQLQYLPLPPNSNETMAI